jgi:hypothetical protein
MDMDEIIAELEEAAQYEGTECSEYWAGLCHMWRIVPYGASDIFIQQVEEEIQRTYDWMKENFTWVECKGNVCSHCGRGSDKVYKELVWNEEL